MTWRLGRTRRRRGAGRRDCDADETVRDAIDVASVSRLSFLRR